MPTSRRFLIGNLVTAGLILSVIPGPAAAVPPSPTKKTTNYVVSLEVNGRSTSGPFTSTEKVTAEIVADPVGGGDDPTQWTGEATLNFGPIESTGLPGCTMTTPSPTGTTKVAITKTGETINVVWSTNSTPPGASLLVCQGYPAPVPGLPAAEPLALLEPKEFTMAATGGTKEVTGNLTGSKGVMDNKGTLTITRRTECGQKVKQVNTYPPGQQTSASSMVGKGFAAGEKVTADTRVEFVFEDGSITRLDKGASIKQDAKCESFTDKSRSFKGTLLLGKIWHHVTEVLGDGQQVYEVQECVPGGGLSCVAGVRGTTFWVLPGKKKSTLSVSEGGVWIARTKAGRLVGKKVFVKKGHTAVMKKKKISVRKLKASDAFPFG